MGSSRKYGDMRFQFEYENSKYSFELADLTNILNGLMSLKKKQVEY